MPRPSQVSQKRRELLPRLADAFTRFGYRRATTAALAGVCGVQENILYRLWSDKKAMFIAAIEYVYEFSEQTWLRLLEQAPLDADGALQLLAFESQHHGEFGHYRILFTGLSETDDPEIRAALRGMMLRFQRFLQSQIIAHRRRQRDAAKLDAALVAWAMIGVGTVANIGRELELFDERDRARLIGAVGRELLNGEAG